jgi:SAM-dependent methyltransferase
MERNVARFSGRVAEYDRYRERYDPAVILERLRAWCGLTPEWLVADVGAGTGMLSEVFLSHGNRVMAIEPNPEMRGACVALHAGEERLQVMDGAAESTGLANGSVDMVSVGRALHWFDLPRAMAEFRRVLRPGGWLAVAGLGRRTDARAENVELERLLLEFTPDHTPTHETYRAYRELQDHFADGRFFRHEIPNEAVLAWEQFRGLVLSLSHAPLQGSAEFPVFETRLEALFARFAEDGFFTLATRYWIAAGQFAPGSQGASTRSDRVSTR